MNGSNYRPEEMKNSTSEKRIRYILVNGFGWSGSSAAVDLLREYNSVFCPGGSAEFEFRLLKDPSGLSDLYHAIVECNSVGKKDIAMRRFIWHAKKLYQKPNAYLVRSGLNYENVFGKNFMSATGRFIERITEFRYRNDWWYYNFMMSKPQLFLKYCKTSRLGKKLGYKPYENAYYTTIDKDGFLEAARDYVDELFRPIAEKDVIMLDNALNSGCSEEFDFFRDAKLLMVDRDPRDIYCSMVRRNSNMGMEFAAKRSAMPFIKYFLHQRRELDANRKKENVCYIRFEDLVFHPEEYTRKILGFFDLDIQDRGAQRFFFPEKSRNNIGLWKKILHMDEINDFERELSAWFYPPN